MAQAGCTGLTSANATDPATATTIAVSGASGSFGSVSSGSSATQIFTVTNTGSNPLAITQIAVTGTGYTITGNVLPLSVATGKSVAITAKFAPTTAGTLNGSISITANTNPSVTAIALTGTGTTAGQPVIAISPGSVSYGAVAIGQDVGQTMMISNLGSGPLTVSNISVAGSGYSITGVTFPVTVDAGRNFTFVARLNPTVTGSILGSLTFANNSANSSLVIPMSGFGVTAQPTGQPGITISPASINFGGVGVGQNVGQLVTISNSGASPLTVSNVAVTGANFSVPGLSLPITVGAGQSATFIANITASTSGAVSGSLTIANNSPTPSVLVPMSGFATAPASGISVSPSSVNFGSVAVGQNVGQLMTISNTGSGSLTVSNIAVTGSNFSVSGLSLPITVGAGQSATFLANVNPLATGSLAGSLTITNSSSTPSVVVPLSGTGASAGQPLLSANPNSVSFGNVTVGAPNSQTIVVQNTGTASLTISQATVSGAGFSMSGLAVPATIAPGNSTTFNVAFGPAGAGAVSGSVSLASNVVGSPTAIPLSGTGISVTKSLGSSTVGLQFGNVAVGSSSSQNVTLTNNGNSTVTIGSVNVMGAGFSSAGVTAGQTIGAGQTAALGITFTPGSAATVSGNVAVTSDATNSPINVALSGTGTQVIAHSVALTWTASTSSVVGYNVYRSTTSGGPYTLITGSPVSGTTFTDTTVQAGVTYFYVVTAVDANGNESVNSNEASATIPTP